MDSNPDTPDAGSQGPARTEGQQTTVVPVAHGTMAGIESLLRRLANSPSALAPDAAQLLGQLRNA